MSPGFIGCCSRLAFTGSDALSPVHISNNVEATFDIVERIVQLVAFDNVASTLLLVWTGLNASNPVNDNLAVLVQCRLVTDGQRDGQTDRQTTTAYTEVA